MKHTLRITLLLLVLFLLSQIVGLFIVNDFLVQDLPYDLERPDIREDTSYISIIALIAIVTIIALIIAKFELGLLWKLWFFLSVLAVLSISFSSFLSQTISFFLALIFAFIKTFRKNIFIHNFTEIFMYGGIAAIFSPIMSFLSVSILLIAISIYDFFAVFKTKHMISLAKFQTKMKLFAGLYFPYKKKEAILGGGDMAFPLLFSGVLLKEYGSIAFLVPFIVTLSLSVLFLISKKNKFYPAMPFLTVGCFIGYLLILLFSYIVT